MKNKAWLVTTIVYLAGITLMMEQYKVGPTMNLLIDQLHISVATGGWLVSVFAVTGMILAIPAGGLLAKLGPKKTGILALICTLAGNFLGVAAATAPILLLSRVIEGIGVGLIGVVGPGAITMWFPPEKRGLPMGIWSTWVSVAVIVIYNSTNAIAPSYGWRGVWWLTAIVATVVLCLYILFVSAPTQNEKNTTSEASIERVSLAESFKSSKTWLLCLVFIVYSAVCTIYLSFMPTYTTQTLGLSMAQSNLYTSFGTLGMIVGGIVMGAFLGRAKNLEMVLTTSMILTGVIMFFAFQLPSAGVVMPFMIIGGVLLGLLPPVVFTLAPETALSPQLAGMAIAIVILGQNVGVFIGPSAIGAIVAASGAWGSATLPLTITSIIGVIAALIMVWTNKSKMDRSLPM